MASQAIVIAAYLSDPMTFSMAWTGVISMHFMTDPNTEAESPLTSCTPLRRLSAWKIS